ncbi:MAG: DUF2345 domain-containing protein, partial [Aquabacterium sp.]|nr:DUF2345 domain-containing protein [Aquabacterium sp.]
DWTAAKRIVLSVSGGASLTIDASGITVQCPGKLTVQAGQKRFVGPSTYAYEANARPGSTAFDEDHVLHWPYDGTPVINRRFEVQRADGTVVRGTTDRQGRTGLQKSDFLEAVSVKLLDEA